MLSYVLLSRSNFVSLISEGALEMDWTSHRMHTIPPSGTFKMFELAKQLESEGKKIYHFEVGQPDFPTPANVVAAGITALKDGYTGYVSARGAPPLLSALEEFYVQRNIQIEGRKNVIVTPGAKYSLFCAFLSALDVGDDVLLLSPAWPTYRVMIRTAGAKPVDVPTSPVYELDEEELKHHMSKAVTALVINSPNNPSGGVLEKEQLKLIYDLAVDNEFLVFSDEIYEKIVYNGFTQPSILDVDTAMEKSVIINGFSKAYSMTGWRLGYAIGHEEIISNMVRIQQNTTSCAPSFVQLAGVEAIKGDQSSITRMVQAYEERRNEIVRLLSDLDGVSCKSPKGAFYAFADFSEYGLSSMTLSELLLKKVGICTAPGKIFGDKWDSHLRFSFASSLSVIREGLAKLKEFLPILK